MPEPSNRDGRPSPDWPVCSRHDDGCLGIRIGITQYCLAHLEQQDPEKLKGYLARLEPGASLDLRGTQLSSELLDQLLFALKTDEKQPPTIGASRFDRVRFSGDVWFGRARFSEDVWFRRAQFSGAASFFGAQFSGTAWFDDAQFSDNAGFDDAQFSDNAEFRRAQFSKGAGFRRAHFSGAASFYGAQFSGDAWFRRAQFTGAWFGRARFSGDAEFSWARFSKDAGFSWARFNGKAGFGGAQFSEGVWFDRAQFIATTTLGPLRTELLRLDHASFGASMVVEVAAVYLSMVGTRFEQEATLSVRYANVLLDRAAFAKTSSLAFVETPFLPSASLTDGQPASKQLPPLPPRDALDEAPLEQLDLPPRPRLLSLRRVDATNLALGDLDLAWCLFRGALNLDKLRIEGPKHFATSPKTWRWTKRRTLAEEQQWRHRRHPDQGWTPPSKEALTKEKPGCWTRRRAFVQVRRGPNIQILPFPLVTGSPSSRDSQCSSPIPITWPRCIGRCGRPRRTPSTSRAQPTSTTARWKCAATPTAPRGSRSGCYGPTGWYPATGCAASVR
jgi:uncharacterized protein YjbI with pentapeptide repeats